MSRTQAVLFALILAAVATGGRASRTVQPSRPMKERAMTQSATYDPRFWIFGGVEPCPPQKPGPDA